MSDQPLSNDISKFFSDYTKPFETRDGSAIAAFYHVPCVSMRPDGSVHCFQSREEMRTFFQRVADQYHLEGHRASSFSDLDVKPIGSKSVLASLEWQMLKEDRSIIRTWRQSYNLIRPDGRWQIFVSTFHV